MKTNELNVTRLGMIVNLGFAKQTFRMFVEYSLLTWRLCCTERNDRC